MCLIKTYVMQAHIVPGHSLLLVSLPLRRPHNRLSSWARAGALFIRRSRLPCSWRRVQPWGLARGAQLVRAAGLLEGKPALGCPRAQRLTAPGAARTARTCKHQEGAAVRPVGWLAE